MKEGGGRMGKVTTFGTTEFHGLARHMGLELKR